MTTATRPAALSASRAADFRSCPLKYRLRAIDRIPEPPGEAAVRGLIVHGVLERLFALPPAQRTREAAGGLVEASTAALIAERPDHAELAHSDEVTGPIPKLLDAYFALEDPTRLADTATEQAVETVLDSGVRVRGYIDRIDTAPNGAVRVVDFKTGRAPSEAYEAKALFQLKLYALLWWSIHGVVPAQLQLLYLTGTKRLAIATSEAELLRFSRILTAMWAAIRKAAQTGDFRATPSKLCDWCSFHALCPVKGGTPPPYPGWPALEEAG
jgi:putative RecB family exonuclease